MWLTDQALDSLDFWGRTDLRSVSRNIMLCSPGTRMIVEFTQPGECCQCPRDVGVL